MALNTYRMTVPVFVRALRILSELLDKGVAHAKETGMNPDDLVNARLAPDMYPLSGQIQRASDASKGAIGRLTDIATPAMADEETTIEDLQERIAKTIAFLESVKPEDMADSAERDVSLKFKTFEANFKGDEYVASFAIPNFFFHIVTAYDILRNQGVQIGKTDYLGQFE